MREGSSKRSSKKRRKTKKNSKPKNQLWLDLVRGQAHAHPHLVLVADEASTERKGQRAPRALPESVGRAVVQALQEAPAPVADEASTGRKATRVQKGPKDLRDLAEKAPVPGELEAQDAKEVVDLVGAVERKAKREAKEAKARAQVPHHVESEGIAARKARW